MAVGSSTPKYLKWSEVNIIFDRSDHPDFIPKMGGGSSLNILFLKTYDQMDLSRSALGPSQTPFHGIVPGVVAPPVGLITLPVAFKTWENFCTEYMQFEVADFEMAYNAFLGSPVLNKFMAIPHYAYLVLKMLGSNGVISIKGDVKQAYYCD
jgi:hypothetical protein